MKTAEQRKLHRLYRALVKAWARPFARPGMRRLNHFLVDLGCSGLGIGNSDSRRNGESRLLQNVLSRAAQSGSRPVIWDVGANEGDYTGMVLEFCPSAVIHAFEPHPGTFARLQRRYHDSSVRCHPFALGASSESLELWDYVENDEGTSHATFYPEMVEISEKRNLRPRSVRVRTIDEVAREEGVESISLLKLDVEGHELACLDGARELLARGAIGMVQFEFNASHLEARVHMGDFATRLPGFDLFRILPTGLLRLNFRSPLFCNLYHMQNILAVPRTADSSPLE